MKRKRDGTGAQTKASTYKSPAEAGLLYSYGKKLRLDSGDFGWVYQDEAALLATVLEANYTGDLGEESIVLAATDVQAGLERCAALTDDDAATKDCLAAEYLDA